MKSVAKRNYTGIGIAMGAGLGAVAGVTFGQTGLWLSLGILIGMVIGGIFGRSNDCPECTAAHRSHQLLRTDNQSHKSFFGEGTTLVVPHDSNKFEGFSP